MTVNPRLGDSIWYLPSQGILECKRLDANNFSRKIGINQSCPRNLFLSLSLSHPFHPMGKNRERLCSELERWLGVFHRKLDLVQAHPPRLADFMASLQLSMSSKCCVPLSYIQLIAVDMILVSRQTNQFCLQEIQPISTPFFSNKSTSQFFIHSFQRCLLLI